MSLFDFILAFLLAFNPGISEEDFNNVYSVLDDTRIYSITVDDSAFDKLSQLAAADVMPLDLSAQQSGWLQDIMRALYSNGSSSGTSLYSMASAINNKLVYGTKSVAEILNSSYSKLSDFKSAYDSDFNKFYNGFGFTGQSSSGFLYDSSLRSLLKYMSRALDATYDKISASSSAGGWDSAFDLSWFNPVDFSFSSQSVSPAFMLTSLRNDLLIASYIPAGVLTLGYDGSIYELPESFSFISLVSNGFSGLGFLLSGQDRQTTFSLLSEDITQDPDQVTAGNILDALGIMGTQLQNPLQRLAYVFANPLDLEIRENVAENQEAANENFFKPGSAGSVKSSDIGEAAGFASGAGDFLQTGASPSDAFSALSQGSDNWGFFSQAAMEDMLGNPPPSVQSDDIPYELGEDGFYHILPSHLFEIESKLAKGG